MNVISLRMSTSEKARTIIDAGHLADFINDCAFYTSDNKLHRHALAVFVENLDDDGRSFLRWLAAQAPEVTVP